MRNFLRSISSPSAVARDLVVLIHGFGAHKASLLPLSVAIADGRYHILNHGYLTRQRYMHEHSDDLIDAVSSRIEKERPDRVHFVTHSFGGCVLRSAFGRGLQDVLPSPMKTRAVLIGPPLRGAVFGRNFEDMALGESVVPKRAREALRTAARYYVGPKSGLQLISKSPEWFEQAGAFPTDINILVIEGKLPVNNPIIGQESDGIVTCQETMLPTPHRRYTVSTPHNLMLLSPSIMRVVKDFLDGNSVGDEHPGVPLVCDGKYGSE